MPALSNVLLCAVMAAVFWTLLGALLSRLIITERVLIWAIAPTLGWAVFNTAALPILVMTGFTRLSITILAGVAVAVSSFFAWRAGGRISPPQTLSLSWYSLSAGALLALAPAIAVLPKVVDNGIRLTPQMYDHSKIAIVDDLVRLGLPAGNPFFGGAPSHLAYYYLWHFGAAVFAKLLGISGWEADIALTWFTAFASLMLMMGLAVHFSGRSVAALWVVLLSVALSLRPVLLAALGPDAYNGVLSFYKGLQGWMLQATWSPQHLAAASSVIVAVFLMSRLAEPNSRLTCPALALVVAAGFESSTWIGGITFGLAALPVATALIARTDREGRRRFITRGVVATVLVVAITLPFVLDQYAATAARQAGTPIGFRPYEVLGPIVADPFRRVLDLPAFWLVLLVVEFPAIYVTGSIVLARAATGAGEAARRHLAGALAALTLVCFVIAWLLVSRILNNDLGWRAVLPGVLVLTIFSAVGLSRWIAKTISPAGVAALVLLALGLPSGLMLMTANATGLAAPSAATFATTPALWEAVRRHSAADERIASNPRFLVDMVDWPVNISWALLADRRSCYAGWDLARAFVARPAAEIDRLEALFQRVFSGDASSEEVSSLADRYECRLIILTPSDGAWDKDEFAASSRYRLVEEKADRWKIYRESREPPS